MTRIYAFARAPAPTSDCAFFHAGFSSVAEFALSAFIYALRDPKAKRFPAFEAYAQHIHDHAGTGAAAHLMASGVAPADLLDIGSDAHALFQEVKTARFRSHYKAYVHTFDQSEFAYQIPIDARVLAGTYRREKSMDKAAVFLNANKANRDSTPQVLNRGHVRRAIDAFQAGRLLWCQSRHCRAVTAEGLDPATLLETFDDALLRTLIEARHTTGKEGFQSDKLRGIHLFDAMAQAAEDRGTHIVDEIFGLAQRLDAEEGNPFGTMRAFCLLTLCPPLASSEHGPDVRMMA